MDFFDDAFNKTKDFFNVACQKTEEAVGFGKIKLEIATLENKRSKDFEALGKLYFERVKDSEVSDAEANNIVMQIKEKTEKIAALNADINNAKNKEVCSSCGAIIEKNTLFCSFCGVKINKD